VRLIKRIPPGGAVRAAIILLVAGFAVLGLMTVDRYVKGLEEFRLKHLKLVDLPGWCPPEVVERLQGLPEDQVDTSIYDPQLLVRVAERYRGDPWVRKVIRVRTEFPDTLAVSLELRRPAYAVEKTGSYRLVDREAYVLPARYGRWSQTANPLLFIWGVRSNPPRTAGAQWCDAAVLGAIETLEAITGRAAITERLAITGADVSNFNGIIDGRFSDIDIIAEGNCTIAWGRPPSTKKFGEIPVGKKLDYIEKFLKEHPDTTGIKIPARLAEAGDGILISDTQDRIR
jgi:hypothetical protein